MDVRFSAWYDKKMYQTAFPSWNGDVIVWEDDVPQSNIKTLCPIVGEEPILLMFTGRYGSRCGDIIEAEFTDDDSCIGKTYKERWVVTWNKQKAKFEVSDGKYHVLGTWQGRWDFDYLSNAIDVKVIGNIYEHPHLLGDQP